MVLDGYVAREAEEWDRTRHIMAFVKTYGGMGASKFADPRELVPLHKDKAQRIKPIKDYKGAMQLLDTFNLN